MQWHLEKLAFCDVCVGENRLNSYFLLNSHVFFFLPTSVSYYSVPCETEQSQEISYLEEENPSQPSKLLILSQSDRHSTSLFGINMLGSNELPEKGVVLCFVLIHLHMAWLLFVFLSAFYTYLGISRNQPAGLRRNVRLQVSLGKPGHPPPCRTFSPTLSSHYPVPTRQK